MRKLFFAALLAGTGLMGFGSNAYAVGCVSGAVVGGVAGHVAGHHGLLGAAAGCAIGHHEAVVAKRQRYNDPDRGYQRESTYRAPGPDRDTYGRDAYQDNR